MLKFRRKKVKHSATISTQPKLAITAVDFNSEQVRSNSTAESVSKRLLSYQYTCWASFKDDVSNQNKGFYLKIYKATGKNECEKPFNSKFWIYLDLVSKRLQNGKRFQQLHVQKVLPSCLKG